MIKSVSNLLRHTAAQYRQNANQPVLNNLSDKIQNDTFIRSAMISFGATPEQELDEAVMKIMSGADDNAGIVESGKLYRGKSPEPEQISKLKEAGIRTIIDLRVNSESKPKYSRAVKQTGINLVNFPIALFQLGTFLSKQDEIERCMKVIRDAEKPAYIHCSRGMDRTGVVIGFYRKNTSDMTVDQIIAEAQKHCMGSAWVIFLERYLKKYNA